MSIVSKELADRVIAGEFAEDEWVQIIKYTNASGGESYGLETDGSIGRYSPSPYVQNPTIYWKQT